MKEGKNEIRTLVTSLFEVKERGSYIVVLVGLPQSLVRLFIVKSYKKVRS